MEQRNRSHDRASANLVNFIYRRLVYNSLTSLRRLVYPDNCLFCGDPGDTGLDVCAACFAELPWNTQACRQCALPLPAGVDNRICGQCQTDPPSFDRALAPLHYNNQTAWLIAGLKFRQQWGNARLLGRILADQLSVELPPMPDRIIPVPLHPGRLRQRGYNQALEIARPVARRFKLPLDQHSIRRSRATPPQSALSLKQRRRNIRGAFTARQRFDDEHIAIIDDVVTSTATVRELARALKQAGAASVSVWCVARAPTPGSNPQAT